MSFHKLIRRAEYPPRADKSALGAINRPLQMGFGRLSIFGRIAYVKWIAPCGCPGSVYIRQIGQSNSNI